MKPEKLAAGRYRYRGRYVIRTTWGPGPRGGEKPRWEVANDDAYGGVTIQSSFTHMTMKEAMTEIDQGPTYKQVPAHIRESTGQFCSGGELWTENGRCQMGCDHADHYANDGHSECEDLTAYGATAPFHQWPSTTNVDKPAAHDFCQRCGVRRFSDDPETIRKAAGPCPKADLEEIER